MDPDDQDDRADDRGDYLGGEGVKIGHPGNWTPVIEYQVIEEELPPEPPRIGWTRVIFWAIGVSVIALCVLAGFVILSVIHHLHVSAPSSGQFHNAGGVLEILIIGAIIITIGKLLNRLFRR